MKAIVTTVLIVRTNVTFTAQVLFPARRRL
jgi:hypothetical protein